MLGGEDAGAEETFNCITGLAARLLGAPFALVSLMEESRNCLKSHHGFEANDIQGNWEFFSQTLLSEDILIVPNATADDRFRFNPLVIGEPHVRFYAGIPLRSRDGQTYGTLSVVDQVPRSGLSDMQRKILRELAGMVINGLGADQAVKQMRQGFDEQQDLLERSQNLCRAKSDFLAHLSHELRNPLNAVLGYTDLMLSAPHGPLGDTRYRDYMLAVQASGSHMLSLVTDILEFAKLESGGVKLTFEMFDLHELFHQTQQMLARSAEEKGVFLLFPEAPEGKPSAVIEADVVKVRQILINLVSNAIKFTPAGGLITLQLEQTGDKMVRFKVKDTGIGIAPENMERVMAPFGQVAGAASHEGFGLGLPITKGLIERHGGRLHISSTPGVGTEVEVQLPCRH
ncbi:sensor histidine kinase [Govanella unica]|uniref:histidine kinase n=1 Tax=Govanella unica TaxID=2975056 RepID=A0A9X3TZU8_9PROT|nr:GAF domain-containing sensor histidine kinase [Govania unica]MDA5194819.1 GAF domain-containing sensor histidine kinase [Govania unica]